MILELSRFTVNRIYIAIKIRSAGVIYLADSLGKVELIFLIAGIKNTEFLAVGRCKEYVMTAKSKESGLALGVTYVANYLSATSELLYSLAKLLHVKILKVKHLCDYRTQHGHIGTDRMVCHALLGNSNAFLNIKACVGEKLDCHTDAAKSAARFSDASEPFFVSKSLNLYSGVIGDVNIFKLIDIFHLFSPFFYFILTLNTRKVKANVPSIFHKK